MAAEYYIFTGREAFPPRAPRHVTHVLIDRSLEYIPMNSFYDHPNIEVVECHHGVEKIGVNAFHNCPRLRRVIMPGVNIIGRHAFNVCRDLKTIECSKLETTGEAAFRYCAMRSVDLPSIKIVGSHTFSCCRYLTSANFGKELESIGESAFNECFSLKRITIPLKDGMIGNDDTFLQCRKLNRVDLVRGVHETITALLSESWKNDLNEVMDSINLILPNEDAGRVIPNTSGQIDPGGKARVIRTWIRSLLRKTAHYKAEHCRCLNVAAATLLELALPNDIVFKNVIPFLELPLSV